MIKEAFDSVKDYLKTRTTNPFFGSLIVVWIIKNWRLLYGVINFDTGTKLNEKLFYISHFYTERSFLGNLSLCIFVTFIVLIVSYVLINLSRLIVNFFDNIVTPIIYRITDKNSIVLKSEYDSMVRKTQFFAKRLNEEQNSRIDRDFPELIDKPTEKPEKPSNPPFPTPETEVDIIVSLLIADLDLKQDFLELIDQIAMPKPASDSKAFTFAKRYSLLEQVGQSTLHQWTPLGQKVKKVFLYSQ